ncbi:MAG: hypothetical protein Q8N03_10435 [Ignavibacteria bacterium]|nr:hypothetical protein [Ignavibacteria bacterium]
MTETRTRLLFNLTNYFLGLLFVFSAVSKLFPIHSFELTIVTQKIIGWEYAPYLSRAIIGFEFFLGLSFFQKNYLKQIIYPFSFILLIIFNFHLSYLILTGHSADNCGCFGQLFPMTSLEALIKNLFLNGILIYLFVKIPKEVKSNIRLPITILIISYLSIFILFPIKSYVVPEIGESQMAEPSNNIINEEKGLITVDSIQAEKTSTAKNDSIKQNVSPVKMSYDEVLSYSHTKSIFSSYKNFSNGVTANIDEGINIVALFSLDCDHCMEAAKHFATFSTGNKFPPLYILFLGEQNQVKPFFDFAGKEFPYIILVAMEFFPFLTSSPPRIILLNNGNIIADSDKSINIIEKLKKN